MAGLNSKRSVRLPGHATPERYAITLQPDLKRFIFEGEEIISLRLGKTARKLTLHSKNLEILSVEISKGGSRIAEGAVSYDPQAETATFDFKKELRPGKYALKVIFKGELSDDIRGFYRSSYKVGRETRYMATTQFESTDARRAFPCFDEPAIKAVFDITLVVPSDKEAISNTIPLSVRKLSGGLKRVTFAPTPKMSTYLLAFIVGDFECIQRKTAEGVLVRVFVTPGKKHQARFALDCAVKTLSFFTKYFGIPYPLPVLDMVAIPDFESSAMENWGAITYRESVLLFDEEHSSTANKQWTALVIAHEIGHQWFGNLVTMEWWTHLWLNEGFASYIEYVAVDHLFPEWKVWEHFISYDLGRALKLDALKHTHPIQVEVHHPAEIDEIFDAVSYSKGASVIRMLADYLGEEDFRRGLSYYLKKHSYRNTSTVHLWQAFQKASAKPVEKMMRQWTLSEGYPLIDVSRRNKGLFASQSRFFSNPASGSPAKQGTWLVPIKISSEKTVPFTLALSSRSDRLLPGLKDSAWIKLNAGEGGLFRVNYPQDLWQALGVAAGEKTLSTADRLGLVRDIAALAEAGKLSAMDVLEFLKHYRNETDYFVWLEISAALNQIYALIADQPFAPEFQRFALSIFSGVAADIGWQPVPGEGHARKLLRNLVIFQMGYYGDGMVIRRARELFANAKGGLRHIPADLRGTVYSLVARYGGEKEHAKLLRLYRQASMHEERDRLGSALCKFKDKDLLEKSLAFSLSKEVRPQDALTIIASAMLNLHGRAVAWKFMKKNWPLLVKRYGAGFSLSRLVNLLAGYISKGELEDVKKFFAKNAVPLAARRSLQQSLERAAGNAAWMRRDAKAIGRWLV